MGVLSQYYRMDILRLGKHLKNKHSDLALYSNKPFSNKKMRC